MKGGLALLKLVAIVLFVICAIIFFVGRAYDVGMGLFALGFVAWAASDLKM